MARIETYVEDNLVTENDIILGSDGDNTNQTKNFRVSALTQFLQDYNLNLKPKVVTTYVPLDSNIPATFTGFNLTVTADDNPVFLVFLQEATDSATGETIIERFVYSFNGGTGTYTDITSSQLTLIEFSNPTVSELSSLDNTTIIDLGDITGSDFLTEINGAIPSYALTDSNETYFFTYQDGNIAYIQKFIGTNGSYGANDLTAVAGDFISFTDVGVDDDNVKCKFIEVTLGATSYATDALEEDAVIVAVNALSSFDIKDDELFVIYSETLENDAGTNYRSVYLSKTGKGTYGSGGTQLVKGDVLKISGTQVDENLSSYTNDSNFADTTAVGLKVSKAGDTMSGDLNMGDNNIVSLRTPTDPADAVNKTYADSLVNFRGTFSDVATLKAVSSPSDGDYAYLSSGDVEQLWVYNTAWVLASAKPYYLNITTDLTISDIHHNATINIGDTGLTLTFPDGLENGINVGIRNFSGGALTIAQSGTATVSETSLPTSNLATAINNSDAYVIDTTGQAEYDRFNYGIYDYDSTTSAVTLTGGSFTTLTNNGAGSNTYKNPVTGIADIWNVSTNRFDFSNLTINDFVKIRLDLSITTASAGEVIDVELVLGEGQAGEYEVPFTTSKEFKSSGTYRFVEDVEVYIGNALTRDNPALIRIKSSGNDDVTMNGFFVKVQAQA